MSEYTLIHEFKCSKDKSIELDVYDNKGLISLESMRNDEVVQVYLSVSDESALRYLLNKRNKESNETI